jgi:ABC-2 type transport system permease protein
MKTIIVRELRSYFKTPLGYVYMGLFLLVSGFFFTFGNLFTGSSYFTAYFRSVLFVYVFVIPLLTMRLLSEERKNRTDQLLLTSPISVTEIVLGKFLAAFAVFCLTTLVTVSYAAVVYLFGDLPVWNTVAGYIGFVLIGACFISVGVLISALSQSQVTAAFFTFFVLLLIWLLDSIRLIVPRNATSGLLFAALAVMAVGAFIYINTKSWIPAAVVTVLLALVPGISYLIEPGQFRGLIARALEWVSFAERFEDFNVGLIEVEQVVFCLSFIGVLLLITIQLVDKRRWA